MGTVRITEIIDIVKKYIDNPDIALIEKGFLFSAQSHEGQTRLSGEPYLLHPLQVAKILAEMEMDEATIVAGLLHDTVEDTDISVDEIEDLFGEEVADIVDGVTKIGKMEFTSKAAAQAENIRKMILAMAEDIRVLMVKLADRLHNMRTLSFHSSIKQQLIAQETLDIYAPLANRLGLHFIKVQLEDLCLKYLKPDVYEQLEQDIKNHHMVDEKYIKQVVTFVQNLLSENSMTGTAMGRIKHYYSTHNKMQQQNLSLADIADLVAFRVIVDGGIKECYALLGLVHSLWRPVPGKFKDYISMPKANMYQSLHTTVIGPEGERIEIQIRTNEMNRVAEYGIAAHWQYKEGKKHKKGRDAERFTWLRQILDWQRELKDPQEFMASLRFDLFQDEVYVFTPNGEIKELPEGATPIDFAYTVHTQVGNSCVGAKVNGKLIPIDTPLKNGDKIEIITQKGRTPSRDWLKFVKTAKARTSIKQYVRTEERERTIAFGKDLLEKELRRAGMNLVKISKEGWLMKLAANFFLNSADDLLVKIGHGNLTAKRVVNRLESIIEESTSDKPAEKEDLFETKKHAHLEQIQQQNQQVHHAEGIKVSGVDNVLMRFASCCSPLPGEPAIGYISRGRGLKASCPHVQHFEEERLVPVFWEGEEDTKYHPADIKIRTEKSKLKEMLSAIAKVLNQESIELERGSFTSRVDGSAEIDITVGVLNHKQLHDMLSVIRSLDGVKEATRSSTSKFGDI